MSGRKARCFLGIPLPPAIRRYLGAMASTWRDAGLRGAWVREENLHITVRFLGEVPLDRVEENDGALAAIFRNCPIPSVRIVGSGVFPDLRGARVWWAGVESHQNRLDDVMEAGESCATLLGLAPERRPHRPHVTLLRMRRPPSPSLIQDCLMQTESAITDEFSVPAVALWESTLASGGAIYQRIREFPLS